MDATLFDLARVDGAKAPDLVEILRRRRAGQEDRRVPSAEVEFRGVEAVVSGEPRPLTPSAARELKRVAGLSLRVPITGAEPRLREWMADQGSLLLRSESGSIRAVLPGSAVVVDNLEILDALGKALRALPVDVKVEVCTEEEGDLTLTLVAPQLGQEVGPGDSIYGGLYLASSETSMLDTEVCARVFRVACSNGMLVDSGEGRRLVIAREGPAIDWKAPLARVVARSFEGGTVDEEAKRLRSTLDSMLPSPYELLVNLRAQNQITDDEQSRIQAEFNRAEDLTMFGFLNAVTRVAHVRFGGTYRRFALERLAGEILGGDHLPPAGVHAAAF